MVTVAHRRGARWSSSCVSSSHVGTVDRGQPRSGWWRRTWLCWLLAVGVRFSRLERFAHAQRCHHRLVRWNRHKLSNQILVSMVLTVLCTTLVGLALAVHDIQGRLD